MIYIAMFSYGPTGGAVTNWFADGQPIASSPGGIALNDWVIMVPSSGCTLNPKPWVVDPLDSCQTGCFIAQYVKQNEKGGKLEGHASLKWPGTPDIPVATGELTLGGPR